MGAGSQLLEPLHWYVIPAFVEPGQRHDHVSRFGLFGLLRQPLPLYEDIQGPSDVEGQRMRLHAKEGDALRRRRPAPHLRGE